MKGDFLTALGSADIGVKWSFGLFYDHDERTGIHYVATGVGETDSDNVVQVVIDAEGDVQLNRLPLKGPDMPRLEECGPDFWKEYFSKRREDR